MLDLSLLGCGGMMPLPNRFLTSLMLRYNGALFLVDCGEGTQVSIKKLGWGYKQIGVICFTHFHADHISGLPGILLAIGNSNRREPLTIIGPPGVKRVVESLRVIAPELPYAILYYEVLKDQSSFYFDGLNLKALPVEHSLPCFAYCFELERQGKFDVARAKNLGLPVWLWSRLQRGETLTYEEKVITPDMVLGKQRKGLKVCYTTDLRPSCKVSEFARNADLFICEGIYGDESEKQKAKNYKHCMFSEAAQMAIDAHVKELWLTHFSPSMPNPDYYIENAQTIFENTKIGRDRKTRTLCFDEAK